MSAGSRSCHSSQGTMCFLPFSSVSRRPNSLAGSPFLHLQGASPHLRFSGLLSSSSLTGTLVITLDPPGYPRVSSSPPGTFPAWNFHLTSRAKPMPREPRPQVHAGFRRARRSLGAIVRSPTEQGGERATSPPPNSRSTITPTRSSRLY